MNIKMSRSPAKVNNSLIDLIIADFRVRKTVRGFRIPRINFFCDFNPKTCVTHFFVPSRIISGKNKSKRVKNNSSFRDNSFGSTSRPALMLPTRSYFISTCHFPPTLIRIPWRTDALKLLVRFQTQELQSVIS